MTRLAHLSSEGFADCCRDGGRTWRWGSVMRISTCAAPPMAQSGGQYLTDDQPGKMLRVSRAGKVGNVAAMHVYDSIVILEKRKMSRPLSTRIGKDDA
jgi:hypothetical protein